MANKTALVLGSSGLVGAELLTLCLESDYYKKVITPLRTPLPIHDDKRKEIIIAVSYTHLTLPTILLV